MTNSTSPRKLQRSDDRMLAGVCSGLADYFGLDTTLVRVLMVLVTLFAGFGPLVYIVGWIVMPDARGQSLISRRAPQVTMTADPHAASGHAPSAPPAHPAPPADPTMHEPPRA